MQKTLIQAYLNSSYTYSQTRLHLDPSPHDLPIVFPERWAMVTAYNPESRQQTAEENQKRHEDLEAQVRQMGFPVDHYVAGEGEWEEPGYLIRGIPLAAAAQLGKDFEQNAVLFGVGARVALVWLDPLLVVRMWWISH